MSPHIRYESLPLLLHLLSTSSSMLNPSVLYRNILYLFSFVFKLQPITNVFSPMSSKSKIVSGDSYSGYLILTNFYLKNAFFKITISSTMLTFSFIIFFVRSTCDYSNPTSLYQTFQS